MRVIGGEHRGRPLKPVPGTGTRPTTDRVREAMMSSVAAARAKALAGLGAQDAFEGAVVLDAFAGSGALGLEALSRGAAHCSFFEEDSKAFQVVKANASSLGYGSKQVRLVKGDVLKLAANQLPAAGVYDLVFLDPPYVYGPQVVTPFILDLVKQGRLASPAIIVYEHALDSFDFDEDPLSQQGGFVLCNTKRYGDTQVSIIRYDG